MVRFEKFEINPHNTNTTRSVAHTEPHSFSIYAFPNG